MNANERKILEDAGLLYPTVVTNADRNCGTRNGSKRWLLIKR